MGCVNSTPVKAGLGPQDIDLADYKLDDAVPHVCDSAIRSPDEVLKSSGFEEESFEVCKERSKKRNLSKKNLSKSSSKRNLSKKKAPASNCQRLGTTVMFVDIDGVLNVGVKDPGFNAISLNEANMFRAKKMNNKDDAAQKLLAVCTRELGDEDSTYEELCRGSKALVDIFVKRLAELIMVAEAHTSTTTVLSSSWRTRNLKGVRALEEALSKHMGAPFTFDAVTDSEEAPTPGGRLENIGNFLNKWSASCGKNVSDLHVLVLEDFHITPFNGWLCRDEHMTSRQDVEKYLRNCISDYTNVGVRLLHTYDEWTTKDGAVMMVGSGVTMRHFRDAMAFLKNALSAETHVEVPWDRATSNPCDLDQTKNPLSEDLGEDCGKPEMVRAISCP